MNGASLFSRTFDFICHFSFRFHRHTFSAEIWSFFIYFNCIEINLLHTLVECPFPNFASLALVTCSARHVIAFCFLAKRKNQYRKTDEKKYGITGKRNLSFRVSHDVFFLFSSSPCYFFLHFKQRTKLPLIACQKHIFRRRRGHTRVK